MIFLRLTSAHPLKSGAGQSYPSERSDFKRPSVSRVTKPPPKFCTVIKGHHFSSTTDQCLSHFVLNDLILLLLLIIMFRWCSNVTFSQAKSRVDNWIEPRKVQLVTTGSVLATIPVTNLQC